MVEDKDMVEVVVEDKGKGMAVRKGMVEHNMDKVTMIVLIEKQVEN